MEYVRHASISAAITQNITTASNSFQGSLNIAKGLTAASFQGGGLAACSSATSKLLYTSGQFSCGTDDDVPEVGDFSALVGGLAIDNNSGTLDFDPTELINSRTWSDGTSDSSLVWTFNLSAGTDPTLTFDNSPDTLELTGGSKITFKPSDQKLRIYDSSLKCQNCKIKRDH